MSDIRHRFFGNETKENNPDKEWNEADKAKKIFAKCVGESLGFADNAFYMQTGCVEEFKQCEQMEDEESHHTPHSGKVNRSS